MSTKLMTAAESNPIQASVLILYPLKTPENSRNELGWLDMGKSTVRSKSGRCSFLAVDKGFPSYR